MAQELNLDERDNAMNDKRLSIKKLIWDKNTMTFVDYDTFERPTEDQLPINDEFRHGDFFNIFNIRHSFWHYNLTK